MLPHLWRMPQWLACGSYLALAALAVCSKCSVAGRAGRRRASDAPSRSTGPRRGVRLIASLAVILAGLGVAWYAIEVLHSVRVTVFQPFRMATVARGIALVFVAGGSSGSGEPADGCPACGPS